MKKNNSIKCNGLNIGQEFYSKVRLSRKLFILILFGLMTNSFAQIKIGKINDTDGFVNIREHPSDKSKVVNTIKENEIFEYIENEYDWWWVTKLNGDQGFVHNSRIKEVTDGIIFRNLAYCENEYYINTERINWNKFIILIVLVNPKLRITEYENYNEGVKSAYTRLVKCSVQIRIYSNHEEINRLEYFNIEAVGGYAGVSFPKKQISKKFIFGCKYGDYDGRLIQIDSSGKIKTYPGGNFIKTPDRKYIISPWDSDITGITVIDLDKGTEYFRQELEGGEELGEWYENKGEYYVYLTDDNSAEHDKVLKINIKDKSVKRVKMDHSQLNKYIKIDLLDDILDKGCKCAQ